MTITLLWWYLPLAMVLLAIVLIFAWPDEPSGHFMAGGPGILKMGAILLLVVGAICVCIGKWLA